MTIPAWRRRWLWVDRVGGYLLCPAERVTLGRAGGAAWLEAPLLADLASRHATLRRAGESYLLEPHAPVRLDGAPLDAPAMLTDGREFTLGERVVLRFRQPHPWSGSARLEFVSRHRTEPRCDGLLLLADTLVLGPRSTSHVVCPRWEHEAVLIRDRTSSAEPRGAEQLRVNCQQPYELNGASQSGMSDLPLPARLVGRRWSFSLEEE